MRVTFLGTGTSRGIPVIGCDCRVCTSHDPRNKRLRTSVLLQDDANVVIDTSIDFRTQMLNCGLKQLDAVVFTHHHVDHILGLDDVYPFNIWSGKTIPAYASPHTIEHVQRTFQHLFTEPHYEGIPEINLVPIQGRFRVGNLDFEPVEVLHGRLPVLGFRIGQFAYITDVNRIPEAGLKQLHKVRTLVLDGLRYRKHPTHFSLSEAAEVALSVQAEQTWLIHMSHEIDHEEGNASLPDGIRLAYDGLVLEV